MPNPSPTTPANQALRILGGFVLGWLLINPLASVWISGRQDAGNTFLPHKQNIAQLEKPVEVLFFGNSFSSSAIQPALLARELPNLSSYNHSILVGGVASAHITLNDWLESQNAPKAIVWTLSHFELSGKPSIVTMKFEQRAGLNDLSWILDAGEARGELLQYMGRNILAPVARDAPLWTQWLRQNAQPEAPLGPEGAQLLDAQEPDKDPVAGFNKTRAFYKNLMTNGFERDGKTAGVIASFKKRCDSLGIRLIIVAPPTNSQHAALFHSAEDHDWAWTALQGACQASSIELWDLRQEFTDEDFADGVHLQKRVIPEFNRRMALRIGALR